MKSVCLHNLAVALIGAALASSAAAQVSLRPELGRPPVAIGSPQIQPSMPAQPRGPMAWFDITSRAAIQSAYLNTLVPTVGIAVGWTGSIPLDVAGTTSQAYRDAALTRINWYRALAGVPPVITFDATYSAKDQQAALMFISNHQISHTPPNTWVNWSQAGADAAGASNICLMYGMSLAYDPGCIKGYMDDDGSNNTEVGHRRWLLYPQTQSMGTGDAETGGWAGNAVWVQDSHIWGSRPATREAFVAWPPPGYVPYQLIPARWSVSLTGASFTNATVTMTRGGTAIPVTLLPVGPDPPYIIGEPTLAWEPSNPVPLPLSSDTAIIVTVSNITGSGPITYTVTAFDPNTTPSGTPPDAPVLVSPANGATSVPLTGVQLTWNASSGATSYDVYFGSSNPPGLVFNTSSVSYSPGTLTSGTYYWQVVAKNSSGSGASGVRSFTTVASAPAAPVLVSPSNGATSVPLTGAQLTWNTSSGATSYDVYFGSSNPPAQITTTSNLAYLTGSLASGTYYWKIVATNTGGSAASAIWSFTTVASAPAAPVLVSPSNGATSVPLTGAQLTWNASSGATSYDVYFGSSNPPALVTTNTSNLAYLTGSVASGTYYWQIVAKNSGGSAASAIWSFTTVASAPAAPVLVSPSNGATSVPLTGAQLTWNTSSGATSYDVYFSSSNPPALITNTSSVSYSPGNLASGTYYWQIVAKNTAGSGASAVWSFTTVASAPAAPVLVSPSNGATSVPLSGAQLTWNASSGATSYEVYFGSSNPPALITNTSSVSYSPGNLASGTYYWQIVAKNTAGSGASAVWSFTTVASAPAAPVLVSPPNGATSISLSGAQLTWNASSGATSYDVYFGPSNPPALVAHPSSLSYSTGGLASGTYYWQIVAKNTGGSAASSVWAFTTTAASGAPPAPVLASPANGATSVAVSGVQLTWNASAGATSYDVYFGSSNPPPMATNTSSPSYSPGVLVSGTYYWQVVARNSAGSTASPVFSFATSTATTGSGLQFVPVTPCRVVDTRAGQGTSGAFGPPSLTAGATRSFSIPQGRCGIPSSARAYSVNVTVVPPGTLGYLTLWPDGVSQPYVSTLNAPLGGVVANAAVVPAGDSGAVNVYATDSTDLVMDINGYFTASAAYAFYPVNPCRVADTRNSPGSLGGPIVGAGQSRDLPVQASACGIPSAAQAYSLNVTAVPQGALGYLTVWPTGETQPFVSTLNSWDGRVVANAALMPSGTNGAVSAYATNATHVVLDVNGYFAAPGNPGSLNFYPLTPCRVLDTRNPAGTFGGPALPAGGVRPVAVASSGCAVPANAQAYSMNITVVPLEPLSYLTVWPTGRTQPYVSTLNSFDGRIVANAAIVPADASGSINVFATNRTHVVIDINGYFAQ